MLKKSVVALLLALGIGGLMAADCPVTKETASDLRERNVQLLEKLSASLVNLDYFFRPDANNELPDYEIRYLCPNCNSMHTGSTSLYLEEQRPFRTPGFAVAPNEFIASDISLKPDNLERLEIVFNGKRYPARVVGYYPERTAVRVRTDRLVEGLRPLLFASKAENELFGFYRVEEESGVEFSAVFPFISNKVLRNLGSGRDYLVTPPNTLIVNTAGEVVALSMVKLLDLDQDWALPPAQWKMIAAVDYEKELNHFAELLKQNIYPAEIRLTQIKSGKSNRYHGRDDDKNEVDALALKLKDGRLLINADLAPGDTARLARIMVTVNGKNIPAQFVGSLRNFGGLVARADSPLPGEGIEFYPDEIARQSFRPVRQVTVKNFGKTLDITVSDRRLDELRVGFRGALLPDLDKDMVFTVDGRLISWPLSIRSIERYRSAGAVGAGQLAEALGDFDPLNVPSSGGEKIAWLGAEFQKLNSELARANEVAAFTRDGEIGVLVSFVYPDSPAASMGLKAGDVLLSITPAGSVKPEILGGRYQDYERFSQFPWEHYDEIPLQYFDEIPIPWGTTRNEFNNFLGRIGIGREASLTAAIDGKIVTKQFTISAAPESFDSIEKFSDEKLGMSVCDLTYEVRNYFQLKPEDSGIMVARVKAGGRAAVAGVKPYEMIVSVNGQPVKGLEAFKSLIAEQSELKLGVRRLAVSRIVTIKLD